MSNEGTLIAHGNGVSGFRECALAEAMIFFGNLLCSFT